MPASAVQSRHHPLRRVLAVAACVAAAVGLVTALAVAPAAAAPSDAHILAGRAAAGWLVTQLEEGHLTNFGQPDWGLTIDALLALEATGADPAAATAVTTEVAAHVRAYNSYDDFGIPDVRIAGATAKLLLAAVAAGRDPHAFGGFDLRAETLDLVAGPEAGTQQGRVRDQIPEAAGGGDFSNTFGQSMAVIGLARSGGVPQPVVDFLIKQQCTAGGFRLNPDVAGTPSPSCDAQPDAVLDVDSTAIAVQALLVAADAGAARAAEAAAHGATWLAGQQHADGSFGGSGPTAAANSNSTGLAGQALAAAANPAAANRAAAWVAGLQRRSAPDAGAIGYDPAAFAAPIDELSRDQWRRATAQALLTLTQVPLGLIGVLDPPTPSTSPTATPTTSRAGPTTSAPATSDPGQGGGLPITGAPTAPLAATGAVLLGLGVFLVLLARRRNDI